MLLSTIPQNTSGEDYICADVHGHFSLLQSQLNDVDFNPHLDRLFSLGDLIDRGEESDHVLQWLDKPWFYAIQGNHERMLINCVESQADSLRFQWFNWGGAWAEDMQEKELQQYYDALSQLPIAIELQVAQHKRVALVHAELPEICDWTDIEQLLRATSSNHIERDLTISTMLWNRPRYLDSVNIAAIAPVENIHHVFHGHTILNQITTLANRTFMDLGSYKTGKIGLIKISDFLSRHDS